MRVWPARPPVGKDDRVNDHIAPPALRPVRGAARCAVAALVLAGAAWAARAVWQIRLAVAGQPAVRTAGPGRRPAPPADRAGERLPHRQHPGRRGHGAVRDRLPVLAVARAGQRGRPLGTAPALRRAWVYAGWIVPVANLWIPRGIVADIHRASAPGEPLPHAVNWWWGLWLVGLLGGAGLLYAGTTDKVIARAYTDDALLLVPTRPSSARPWPPSSSSAPSPRHSRTTYTSTRGAAPNQQCTSSRGRERGQPSEAVSDPLSAGHGGAKDGSDPDCRSVGRRWSLFRTATAARWSSDGCERHRQRLGLAAGAGQAAGHECYEGPLDVGCSVGHQPLIVPRVAPGPHRPRVTPFHPPTSSAAERSPWRPWGGGRP